MARVLLPLVAVLLTAPACLGARSGRVVTGDVVADTAEADTAPTADTSPRDTVEPEDTLVPADTAPMDVVEPSDTAPMDVVTSDTAAPDVVETGCCRVAMGLDGGNAVALDAAACADACGEVAPEAFCVDPPVCCYVPERQNGTYVMPTSECAGLGEVVEDAACPVHEHEVCCRWAGLSIAVELEESVCAATGGEEVLGDYCWDRPALGTQCCFMPDGERRVTSDYQCEPDGGQAVGLTTCWKLPTAGVCCAFPCRGPRYFEAPDQCEAEGGQRAPFTTCAPPGAIFP